MTRFLRWATALAMAGLLAACAGGPPPASGAASALAPASRTQTTRGPIQISYETYALPNGLNVILSRDTTLPVVAVNLWYHVGSANEVPGRTGFAHLFEHMILAYS